MPQADACVLKNKHCVNSLPVLLSLQPPSAKTPTHFYSLDPVHSIDLHGKRVRFGAKPIRGAAPPILGAFTSCGEGGPLVWGKGCPDVEGSWAFKVFCRRREQTWAFHISPILTSRRCLRVSLGCSLCGFRVNCLLKQVL